MHKKEKSFVKGKRKKLQRKFSRKSDKKKKKKQKNNANSSGATAKSRSEYMREYQARKKPLQNTLLLPSLWDGNANQTLLKTAQINTDFLNHSVPSTTEPSTSLVRVGTGACESIIDFILRYKSYDFHKNVRGRGNLVVKVSDRGWRVMSSHRLPLKTRRAGERSMLNLSRAQMSSCWCGS
ncbi:uncharacterized protein TNCV_4168911 [Trichonephila clavipes]|nr:uncharacterized protein TNCV_4168911 [Trichonephila clavipes]